MWALKSIWDACKCANIDTKKRVKFKDYYKNHIINPIEIQLKLKGIIAMIEQIKGWEKTYYRAWNVHEISRFKVIFYRKVYTK
ncbi:hypothetical protein DN53_04725 [Flagellimonas olearia]|uniref:Uncharacterized protein n=1 Tax=Flagellimonas olearia TaxID=552546 RepID=A0A444VS73_9FLAO|nr:hypothetical protein DN53_04725 [Allomuricauda olearia]